MGSFILGGGLMAVGVMLSFIPPFFFGPLLFIAGFAMMFKGLFSTTHSAAKATVAIGRELSRSSSQDYSTPTYSGGSDYGSDSSPYSGSPSPSPYSSPSAPNAQASTAKSYDVEKWEALRKFDPVVKPIYETLLPHGQAAVDEFAKAYIAMNRPDLAETMAAQIIADAQTAKEELEKRRAESLAQKSEVDRQRLANRTASADAFMDKVRKNNMFFNGKRIVHMEPYYGRDISSHGMAFVQYEDGRRELRTETGFSLMGDDD